MLTLRGIGRLRTREIRAENLLEGARKFDGFNESVFGCCGRSRGASNVLSNVALLPQGVFTPKPSVAQRTLGVNDTPNEPQTGFNSAVKPRLWFGL